MQEIFLLFYKPGTSFCESNLVKQFPKEEEIGRRQCVPLGRSMLLLRIRKRLNGFYLSK